MKKILLVCLLALWSVSARAEAPVFSNVTPVDTAAQQAVVLDAPTGAVLFAKDADSKMATSSMSKVLSMYLVFESIKKGKLSLDTNVTVSENAWKQQGSRTFLKIGQEVRIEDLIRGVIIQSGNDSAVALAEAVAGTEGSFAGLMNDKAHVLGMTNSHFMNATGLPDPEHYSTARDLAILAYSMMRDFPEYYHYYSETEFTFNGIKQGNRNPLLYRNIGVDGMKTGHTEVAGYGMISSASHEGRRVIVVVNGLPSMQARADESAKLLDWGFREFALYPILKAGEKAADAKVWLGETPTVPVGVEKDLGLTLPRMQHDQLKSEVRVNAETEAPIHKGQVIGQLTVSAPGYQTMQVPLVALSDDAHLGFVASSVAKVKRLFGKE